MERRPTSVQVAIEGFTYRVNVKQPASETLRYICNTAISEHLTSTLGISKDEAKSEVSKGDVKLARVQEEDDSILPPNGTMADFGLGEGTLLKVTLKTRKSTDKEIMKTISPMFQVTVDIKGLKFEVQVVEPSKDSLQNVCREATLSYIKQIFNFKEDEAERMLEENEIAIKSVEANGEILDLKETISRNGISNGALLQVIIIEKKKDLSDILNNVNISVANSTSRASEVDDPGKGKGKENQAAEQKGPSRKFNGIKKKNFKKISQKELLEEADGGDAHAQFELGQRYAKGIGVAQNLVESMVWYNKASRKGIVDASNALWLLCDKICSSVEASSDATEYISVLSEAAKKDVPWAQNDLAFQYFYGRGVKKDVSEAISWWIKAARNGHFQAQQELGMRLSKGEGLPMDKKKAERMYSKILDMSRKASEVSDITAMYVLRYAYQHGLGVDVDISKSLMWKSKFDAQVEAHGNKFGEC